jgi:hypothetical protein
VGPTSRGIPGRLATALITLLATLSAASCQMPPPGPPYPDLPVVRAHSARTFGDSVGVNTHLSWNDTSYGNFATIESRLRELGVRHIRDGLCPTCTYQVASLNRLAAAGIKANIIAGTLRGGDAEMRATLTGIRDKVRSAVASIEAPNEPNLTGDPDWVRHARAYQQRLYMSVKADPALAHLPVLGPAVGWPATPGDLGDLSSYLDRGNLHPYPGGNPPYYNLASERLRAAAVSGSKPQIATEAGYHSHLSTTGGHLPASERAIGIYTPRLALEGFRGGVERTYIFQLADAWPARTCPVSPEENSFGLLRSDLSRKPSFVALRNLLRTTGAGSAPVAWPNGVRLGLEGAGSDVKRLLLRSSDGSYTLVLWRSVSVWDPTRRVDLYPAADRVDVVLGEPISLARRFDPVTSLAEVQRWTYPRRIPVDLGGAPVVLKLTPWAVAAMAG